MSRATPVLVFTADPNGTPTPIMVDALDPPFTAPPVKIRLSVDLAQLCPPGWPSPPYETGVAGAPWHPRTILAGTTINVFACEAAALVAANAATLA